VKIRLHGTRSALAMSTIACDPPVNSGSAGTQAAHVTPLPVVHPTPMSLSDMRGVQMFGSPLRPLTSDSRPRKVSGEVGC
jgi:hypothetical protein